MMGGKRFWDEAHTEAIYVAPSSGGTRIVVGLEDATEDVWITPARAKEMARELNRLANEARRIEREGK